MISPESIIGLPDDILKAFGEFADNVECDDFPCTLCPYCLDKKQMRLQYRNVPRLAEINCSFVLCKRIS